MPNTYNVERKIQSSSFFSRINLVEAKALLAAASKSSRTEKEAKPWIVYESMQSLISVLLCIFFGCAHLLVKDIEILGLETVYCPSLSSKTVLKNCVLHKLRHKQTMSLILGAMARKETRPETLRKRFSDLRTCVLKAVRNFYWWGVEAMF